MSKAFEGEDWNPEELALFEQALTSRPNGERVYRGILAWIGEKMYELAEKGEVLSCYHDKTERALHPDSADVRSLIPTQVRGNQVDTPVEQAI